MFTLSKEATSILSKGLVERMKKNETLRLVRKIKELEKTHDIYDSGFESFLRNDSELKEYTKHLLLLLL